MVDARADAGGGDVHVEGHGVEDGLQHGGDDHAAPRTAGGEPGLPIAKDDGGAHGGQGPLAARDGVALALHQPEHIGPAGQGGEVAHLVVEQHAGARHRDGRAETGVEGVGVADHVAVAVGDGVLGGVLAFALEYPARRDLRRGRGALVGYQLALASRVGLVGERRHRHLYEIRVTQVLAAVGVRQLHGLGEQVQVGGAVVSQGGQVLVFQQVEDLQDVHAAGGGRGRRHDLEVAEAAANRRPLQGAVGRQVLQRDQAVAALHLRGDAAGDLALVKTVPAAGGDLPQGPGQVGLAQDLADLIGAAVGLEVQPQRFRVAAQAIGAGGEFVVEGEGHREALLGQGDGGRQYLFPAHAAVGFQGIQHARHRARHARGLVAEILEHEVFLAVLPEEHVAARRRGGGLAVVDEYLPLALRQVNQHKAAAPQVARPRVGHRQGEAGGHGRVHHVAPLLQDALAHFGGQLLGADYHAVAPDDGQEALVVIDDGGLFRRRRCPRLGGARGHHCQAEVQGEEGGGEFLHASYRASGRLCWNRDFNCFSSPSILVYQGCPRRGVGCTLAGP